MGNHSVGKWDPIPPCDKLRDSSAGLNKMPSISLRLIYLFIFVWEAHEALGQNNIQYINFENSEVTSSLERCSVAGKDERTRTPKQTQTETYSRKISPNYFKFSSHNPAAKND